MGLFTDDVHIIPLPCIEALDPEHTVVQWLSLLLSSLSFIISPFAIRLFFARYCALFTCSGDRLNSEPDRFRRYSRIICHPSDIIIRGK